MKRRMFTERVGEALEHERIYPDGAWIVRAGDAGREMFIIRSGAVRVTRMVGDQLVELDELGKGDMFGEMALLESLPRDADVRAVGETVLLVLGPGSLLLRLRRDPSFAIELLHRLSGRVRGLNQRLADDRPGSAEPGTHDWV